MKNKFVATAVGLVGFACLVAGPASASAKQAAAYKTTCPPGTAVTSYCTCPPGETVAGYCTVAPTVKLKLKLSTTAKQKGNILTVTITVKNPNKYVVSGKKLYVPIPKGLAYDASSPKVKFIKGKPYFVVGTLKAGATKKFVLKLRVLAGTNRKVKIQEDLTAGSGISAQSASITVKVKHHGATTTKVTG